VPHDEFWWIIAFTIGVIAVARAARLLVYDDFPPTKAVRDWWVRRTGEKWGDLFLCQFCLAPYLAAGDLAWGYLSGVDWTNGWGLAWWLVNLWAAGSYLAAIVVAYDEPE
jgi:hypothetical protein